ncbi:MAG: histidine kinase [Chloroflexi bacterium]|nr:histidine kinase [Chloroflexota bacterium]MDA8187359.1 histidine kinase [Dehalococcoidales bacterium]
MQTSSKVAVDVSLLRDIQELLHESTEELQRVRRETGEIEVLLKQTSSEVEHLSSRATETARKLREMEKAVDTYSRAQIRDSFAAAQEAEMRLFMMKGQLEQLEYKQRSLGPHEKQLIRVIEVCKGIMELAEAGSEDAGGRPLSREPDNVGTRLGTSATVRQEIGRAIDAQEEERQRIARRIHDGPAQALTNLILRTEICQRLLTVDPERAKSELASLKTMITGTLQETRHFIFDLRPMILDDLGMLPTLRRLSETFTAKTNIPVKLNVTGPQFRLPPHVEIALFRITQEALDNAASHANPTEAQVSIELSDDFVRLTIEDNGSGFDVEKVLQSLPEGRVRGIKGMQARIQSLGGRVYVNSAPGKGCKLTIEVAL